MLDLITVGRVSVDLYAQQVGASFLQPQTFDKSIGGSPTNVAVAAARLGLRSAVATKVGSDPLGGYVRKRLSEFGVDAQFVGTQDSGLTPVVLAALDPPEDPVIVFHRGPAAPDTTLVVDDLPITQVQQCRAFWMSACALSTGTTAEASMSWLQQRARSEHTILDLDYRPSFWPDITVARAAAQRALEQVTVVVGNRAECDMALGISDPDAAADALLAMGIQLAIVKMGGGGVLLATRARRIQVAPKSISVVCGLGAGDAFGGALAYGLLAGWDIDQIGAFANAAGAYVAARLTCADAMPDLAALEAFVAQD
jgi:5-dehydro-2-deoxygluconokinase